MRKRAKPPAPPVVDSEGKRHFGMKADAGFYARFKVPPGYKQRATQQRRTAIVNEVRTLLGRGLSKPVAKRLAAKHLGLHVKTVRKVWREEMSRKGGPEDAAEI